MDKHISKFIEILISESIMEFIGTVVAIAFGLFVGDMLIRWWHKK